METEFLIPISFFAMVYGIVYILVRRKERMALVQKGVDASIFDSPAKAPTDLKWGLLLIGIGVGILLGKVLAVYTTLNEEPAFFSMICLFGGIGLIIYHFIANRMEKKNNIQD
jgi:hypothetical protein